MSESSKSELRAADLRMRLEEAEEALSAIRRGEVDALVVKTAHGQQIFALEGAQNAYRVLLETLNEGALTLAEDGTICYSNSRFARLVGCPLERVLGAPIARFVAPEEQERFAALLRRGFSQSAKDEVRLLGEGGGAVPVMLSLSCAEADGRERICTVVVTDLTELKSAQDALQQALGELRQAHTEVRRANEELERRVEHRTAELASANDALRTEMAERGRLEAELRSRAAALAEADRRKDEFLSMLAHELRNPLSPALTALHLMRRHPADGESHRRAGEVAERQLRNLARLVDDLLDVTRITRGRIELRLEPLDLLVVVRQCMETFGPTQLAREHRTSLLLPPGPVMVEADPTRLEQIVGNLLTNASKYTDPGGRIVVRAERQEGMAVLRVSDTGVGIAPELLPHVFDPFVQAERSLDRSQGGLGIGLTLVKRLVELHGGRVEAASGGTGMGSEFTVWLPLRAEAESAPTGDAPPEAPGRAVSAPGTCGPGAPGASGASGPSARAAGPQPAGRGCRVLVVDDNVDAADTLAELLRLLGHTAHTARTGREALALFERSVPDLVLCDLGMPGMDGFEVARRLRANEEATCRRRSFLLVALTGYGNAEDRRRSAAAGFDDHLVKPVDVDSLQRLLARLPERASLPACEAAG